MEGSLKIVGRQDVELIKTFIASKTRQDESFSIFIKKLSNCGQVFLIGGSVRDIISHRKVDDLDMIIKIRKEKLNNFIIRSKWVYKKNKLGGFKLTFKNIIVDIWSIDENWAFKENLLAKKISNIQKSTFFNFDSLVYNICKQKVYSHYYNECIRSKKLDILIDEKDYLEKAYLPESIIVKAFAIKVLYNLEFSNLVKYYIKHFIDSDVNAISKILSCSTKEYRKRIIEEIDVDIFQNME